MREKYYNTLLSPCYSEKAIGNDVQRLYTFRVVSGSSKIDIRAAVEHIFEVKVAKVNTLHVKPKVKRFRQVMGKRKAWKKAYVTLMPGHEIEALTE